MCDFKDSSYAEEKSRTCEEADNALTSLESDRRERRDNDDKRSGCCDNRDRDRDRDSDRDRDRDRDFNLDPPRREVINVFDAVINEVRTDRNATFVTIAYRNCRECPERDGVITLIVDRDTIIRNERGNSVRAGELERGMIINASFSSAMTRSIPPQTQAFFIIIVSRRQRNQTTTGRIIEVNTRNDFILTIRDANLSSVIRFNVTPETVILDPIGRRIRLSSLRPGLRVRVVHAGFMTASIPPQTTAFEIRVIR